MSRRSDLARQDSRENFLRPGRPDREHVRREVGDSNGRSTAAIAALSPKPAFATKSSRITPEVGLVGAGGNCAVRTILQQLQMGRRHVDLSDFRVVNRVVHDVVTGAVVDGFSYLYSPASVLLTRQILWPTKWAGYGTHAAAHSRKGESKHEST